MNYLRIKIWLIITLTFAIGSVIIRLAWELSNSPSTGTLAIVILLILAILGFYALLVYLTIKPNLEKLKSLPVGILVTVIATAGLISGSIHFIRFISSPEAEALLSRVIASLLLLALVSGCFLILWVIWSFRKNRER